MLQVEELGEGPLAPALRGAGCAEHGAEIEYGQRGCQARLVVQLLCTRVTRLLARRVPARMHGQPYVRDA